MLNGGSQSARFLTDAAVGVGEPQTQLSTPSIYARGSVTPVSFLCLCMWVFFSKLQVYYS